MMMLTMQEELDDDDHIVLSTRVLLRRKQWYSRKNGEPSKSTAWESVVVLDTRAFAHMTGEVPRHTPFLTMSLGCFVTQGAQEILDHLIQALASLSSGCSPLHPNFRAAYWRMGGRITPLSATLLQLSGGRDGRLMPAMTVDVPSAVVVGPPAVPDVRRRRRATQGQAALRLAERLQSEWPNEEDEEEAEQRSPPPASPKKSKPAASSMSRDGDDDEAYWD